MTSPLIEFGLKDWGADLQPTQAVCELLDFLDDVFFWVKDREGRYCWVNLANLFNFGLTRREEVLGKTDADLCSPHTAAHFRLDDELVLAGQRILHRIEPVDYVDHTVRWCVTCKLPIADRRGRIIGTTGISRPVRSGAVDWEGMPLGKAMSHLSQHFGEPLSNDVLARLAGMSERTFERRFREHYGMAPHQYLKRLRLRLACQALVQTDRPIAFIAGEHGFADQSYFTHEFREWMGQTPADYRRKFQGNAGRK